MPKVRRKNGQKGNGEVPCVNNGPLRCTNQACSLCSKREAICETALRRLDEFVSRKAYISEEDVRDVRKGLLMYDEHMEVMRRQAVLSRLPTVMLQPHLDSRPFYNLALCDEDTAYCMKRLRRAYLLFRSEYENLKDIYPRGWLRHKVEQGRWESFPFIVQGKLMDSVFNCPAIGHILMGLMPAWMQNCFGNAGFSVIYPNTHIPVHSGPCNIRIRAHLGIHVPESSNGVQCYMEVGGRKRPWKEGDLLLFDDSYPHSITYTAPPGVAAPPRVLFYIDFWHPDVEAKEKEALDDIYRVSESVVVEYVEALQNVGDRRQPVTEKHRCPNRCD